MKRDMEILNEMLLGEFISRFSVGDTWDMCIGDCYLSAHTIEFEEENLINEFLNENYKEFKYSVDKEDVAKSTLMAANLRKPISQISLDEMKNLVIGFENGSTLKILTDTDIVDWQWCINRSGDDPYMDYEIACFVAGEISKKERHGLR
jgi:hypothetical protein